MFIKIRSLLGPILAGSVLLGISAVDQAQAVKTQTFDDQLTAQLNGWIGVDASFPQAAGFIDENEAGGAASGEALLAATRGPGISYLDGGLGMELNGTVPFSMAGRFSFTDVGIGVPDTGTPPVLGFSSGDDDFVGIFFRGDGGDLGPNALSWGIRFASTGDGIITAGGGDASRILTLDAPTTFSLSYDPNVGAFGTLAASIDGVGDPISIALQAAHREILNNAAYTRAGFFKKGTAPGVNNFLEVRVDDLTYTGVDVASFEWTQSSGGSYINPSHWDVGVVPGALGDMDESILFGAALTESATIYNDLPVTLNRIVFDNPGSTYAIAGLGTYTLAQNPDGAVNPTLDVASGSHLLQAPVTLSADAGVTVAAGSMIDFSNQLSLNGNAFDATTGGGTININHSVVGGGTLAIAGALGTAGSTPVEADVSLLNSSTLTIDLGPSNTDHLDVTGVVAVAGVVDVLVEPGYVPSGSYTILTSTGTITDNGLALHPSDAGAFTLQVLSNSIVITVGDGPAGDFDGDGDADGSDFLAWQRGFGAAFNVSHLADWQSTFGAGAGLSAGGNEAVAVPEPTCLAWVLPWALGGRRFRRV